MGKKLNWLDVIKDIEAIHSNITVPIDQEYVNNATKIRYICKWHGEQTGRTDNLKSRQGCPKCGKENSIKNRKSNWPDVIKDIEAIHDNITVPVDQEYINSLTKIRYICKYHGERTAKPASLKFGRGCLKCGYESQAKTQKLNWRDVIKDIEAIHSNITVPIDQEYVNNATKIRYICKWHGEQTGRTNSLKRGAGCPKCGNKNKAKKLKSNWLDLIKNIEEIHPNITVPVDQEYINSLTKIRYICKYHGERTAKPASIKFGRGCLKCGYESMKQNRKANWLNVVKDIESLHDNITVPVDQKYINSRIKIKYICKYHGEQTSRTNSLNNGQGCPDCAIQNRANKFKSNWLDLIKQIESIHDNITIPVDQEYINTHTKIKYICEDHGEQTSRPSSLKRGIGCLECWNENRDPFWTKEIWGDACRKAKGKPILYFIKMTWENENWYKFGITYKGIKDRFKFAEFKTIDIEILKIVSGEVENIWDLEQNLHIFYGNCQYIPDIEFGGDHECYKFKKPISDTEKEFLNLVNDFQKDKDCNFLVSDTE